MNKGRWIYLMVIIVNFILMLLPSGTALFERALSSMNNFDWVTGIPDILALVSVLFGYIGLRLFYKRSSKYIKNYPYVILLVALLWTVAIQVK